MAGRTLAERLRGELGVGPAPAHRRLLARCARPRQPADTPPEATRRCSGEPPSSRRWPRRGRRRGRPRGRVVLITGEAGIGKTRLVAELARRARRRGGARGGRRGRRRRRRGPARSCGRSSPGARDGRAAAAAPRGLARRAGQARSRTGRGAGPPGPRRWRRAGAGTAAALRRRAAAGRVGAAGGRCCSSPRTPTARTGRASPCPRTSVDGWPSCRCCSC